MHKAAKLVLVTAMFWVLLTEFCSEGVEDGAALLPCFSQKDNPLCEPFQFHSFDVPDFRRMNCRADLGQGFLEPSHEHCHFMELPITSCIIRGSILLTDTVDIVT